MTPTPVLPTLAERVGGAREGSRELDALLHVATFHEAHGPDDLIYATVPVRDDHCEPGTYWRHSRSGMSLHTAPHYTASVDAALALVERALGGKWTVARVTFNQNDDRTWHAELREGFLTSYSSVVIAGGYSKYNSGLPNAALAICLALLRALSTPQKDTVCEPR